VIGIEAGGDSTRTKGRRHAIRKHSVGYIEGMLYPRGGCGVAEGPITVKGRKRGVHVVGNKRAKRSWRDANTRQGVYEEGYIVDAG